MSFSCCPRGGHRRRQRRVPGGGPHRWRHWLSVLPRQARRARETPPAVVTAFGAARPLALPTQALVCGATRTHRAWPQGRTPLGRQHPQPAGELPCERQRRRRVMAAPELCPASAADCRRAARRRQPRRRQSRRARLATCESAAGGATRAVPARHLRFKKARRRGAARASEQQVVVGGMAAPHTLRSLTAPVRRVWHAPSCLPLTTARAISRAVTALQSGGAPFGAHPTSPAHGGVGAHAVGRRSVGNPVATRPPSCGSGAARASSARGSSQFGTRGALLLPSPADPERACVAPVAARAAATMADRWRRGTTWPAACCSSAAGGSALTAGVTCQRRDLWTRRVWADIVAHRRQYLASTRQWQQGEEASGLP